MTRFTGGDPGGLEPEADLGPGEPPLSRPPRSYLREEVYQVLRRKLLDLAASASSPTLVREAGLARALGVSRTPVREALNRLQQEGLITIVPNRGVRLVPASLEEYVAWLEVREVLEGLAARLAAERISAEGLARLKEIFAPFTPSNVGRRAPEYARANTRFHTFIMEQSGNPLLKRLEHFYDRNEMLRFRIIERLGRGPQSLREHRAIIAAIENGQAGLAERLSRMHVRRLRSAVLGKLEALEQEPGVGR